MSDLYTTTNSPEMKPLGERIVTRSSARTRQIPAEDNEDDKLLRQALAESKKTFDEQQAKQSQQTMPLNEKTDDQTDAPGSSDLPDLVSDDEETRAEPDMFERRAESSASAAEEPPQMPSYSAVARKATAKKTAQPRGRPPKAASQPVERPAQMDVKHETEAKAPSKAESQNDVRSSSSHNDVHTHTPRHSQSKFDTHAHGSDKHIPPMHKNETFIAYGDRLAGLLYGREVRAREKVEANRDALIAEWYREHHPRIEAPMDLFVEYKPGEVPGTRRTGRDCPGYRGMQQARFYISPEHTESRHGTEEQEASASTSQKSTSDTALHSSLERLATKTIVTEQVIAMDFAEFDAEQFPTLGTASTKPAVTAPTAKASKTAKSSSQASGTSGRRGGRKGAKAKPDQDKNSAELFDDILKPKSQ